MFGHVMGMREKKLINVVSAGKLERKRSVAWQRVDAEQLNPMWW